MAKKKDEASTFEGTVKAHVTPAYGYLHLAGPADWETDGEASCGRYEQKLDALQTQLAEVNERLQHVVDEIEIAKKGKRRFW